MLYFLLQNGMESLRIIIVMDNEAQHIKTAFKKEQYDEAATAAMEVLKRGQS